MERHRLSSREVRNFFKRKLPILDRPQSEEYLGHHDLRDLSPLDFYSWAHVKSTVYSNDTVNVEQLKENVIIAFATLKLRNSTLENVRGNGHRFQQFLN